MLNVGLKKITKTSHCLEETEKIGKSLASKLTVGSVVCFFGDLGSGKTTLIKALTEKLNGTHPNEVNSPTFTYLNIYDGTIPVYHFDLYRLKDHKDFFNKGFDEYFDADGIRLIEWSERIRAAVPEKALCVYMKHLGENTREITIS